MLPAYLWEATIITDQNRALVLVATEPCAPLRPRVVNTSDGNPLATNGPNDPLADSSVSLFLLWKISAVADALSCSNPRYSPVAIPQLLDEKLDAQQ